MNKKTKMSMVLYLGVVILSFATPAISENINHNKTRINAENSKITSWSLFKVKAKIIAKYDYIDSFEDNLAFVYRDKKYGFIDKEGREIVPLKYSMADTFREGLAGVRVGDEVSGKTGFIDNRGKVIIPPNYDQVGFFAEGAASVMVNGKEGFIDKTGSLIVPIKYDRVFPFSEGLAKVVVRKDYQRKCGFVDKSGQEVIPLKYDDCYSFSEGLAAVKVGGFLSSKWGFINERGKEIVQLQYDDVTPFSEGLAGYIEGNPLNGSRWKLMNKMGEKVFDTVFTHVHEFKGGFATAVLGGKYGVINKKGEIVVSPKYSLIGSFNKIGLAQVFVGKMGKYKSGFVDKTGRIVIKPIYDEVWCKGFMDEGYIGVSINGKKAFVSIDGKIYLKSRDF